MSHNRTERDSSTSPLLYSISEAADLLSVSRYTIYDLLDSGTLDGVYQGRRRYVTAVGLRQYVAGLSSTPEAS